MNVVIPEELSLAVRKGDEEGFLRALSVLKGSHHIVKGDALAGIMRHIVLRGDALSGRMTFGMFVAMSENGLEVDGHLFSKLGEYGREFLEYGLPRLEGGVRNPFLGSIVAADAEAMSWLFSKGFSPSAHDVGMLCNLMKIMDMKGFGSSFLLEWTPDEDSATKLLSAGLSCGDIEFVSRLTGMFPDLRVEESELVSVSMSLFSSGEHDDRMMDVLMRFGNPGKWADVLMYVACKNGSVWGARQALSLGAELNCGQDTPILVALKEGAHNVVDFLVDAGAEVSSLKYEIAEMGFADEVFLMLEARSQRVKLGTGRIEDAATRKERTI